MNRDNNILRLPGRKVAENRKVTAMGEIERHLNALQAIFPQHRLTLVARHAERDDANMTFSQDELCLVALAVAKMAQHQLDQEKKVAAPTPGTTDGVPPGDALKQ